MASLDAVAASLARISGGSGRNYPEEAAFEAGPAALQTRQNAIFGRDPGGPRTRIMVTLLHALKARGLRKGLATLCIGGGEATAVCLELV